jgi:hypothetical protein
MLWTEICKIILFNVMYRQYFVEIKCYDMWFIVYFFHLKELNSQTHVYGGEVSVKYSRGKNTGAKGELILSTFMVRRNGSSRLLDNLV